MDKEAGDRDPMSKRVTCSDLSKLIQGPPNFITATSCRSANVVAITTKSGLVFKRDKLYTEDAKLSPGDERMYA
jgi:hypothetical protein